MENKDESTQVTRLERNEVKRSDDFVSFYMNSTQFGYSKWDVQMICGRLTISLDKNQHPSEEVAVITMTPQHAKAVLRALEVNLKLYEKEHGEIIMPEDRYAKGKEQHLTEPLQNSIDAITSDGEK
jgi:hypothetical protein